MVSTPLETKTKTRRTHPIRDADSPIGSPREQQQSLLDFLLECEALAVDIVNTTPNNTLMAHAVELCESYLKTMMDMQRVRQHLQWAQTQGSDLKAQLEKIQQALQEISQQASHNARQDRHKTVRSRDWNTIGGLIDEILRLSPQQISLTPVINSSQIPTTQAVNTNNATSPSTSSREQPDTALHLSVHLFGKFKASLNERDIRRWPRGKGLKILKFLLLHRSTPIPRERLMETFWPDTDTHAARNNLNVALYHLRQDLSRYHKSFLFVHHRDGYYQLNTELSTWVDVEAFDHHLRTAQQHDARYESARAITAYRDAEALYQGDCLEDDLHENWAALISQAYRLKYLGVLEYLGARTLENGDYQECATLWHKAVALDSCNEQAHQRIMYCYLQMGQRQMAMRQYQICEENLRKELGLEPTQLTRQLLEQIRQASREPQVK